MSVIKKIDKEGVVAYKTAYAKIPGSDPMCALFLSQVCYWCAKMDDGVAWITHQAMFEQTGMTRKQQDRAAEFWVSVGIINKFVKGVPPKIHYFVDFDALEALILRSVLLVHMPERDILDVQKAQHVMSERDKTSRIDSRESKRLSEAQEQPTTEQPATKRPPALQPQAASVRSEEEASIRHGASGEQQSSDVEMSLDAQALAIYSAYPRKTAKEAAIKAIAKTIKKIGFDNLLSAVNEYRSFTDRWFDDKKAFIPHPSSWMNKGCYDDDRSEWKRNCKPGSFRYSQAPDPDLVKDDKEGSVSGRGTILATTPDSIWD